MAFFAILWQKNLNLSTVFLKFVIFGKNPLFTVFSDGKYEDITLFSL